MSEYDDLIPEEPQKAPGAASSEEAKPEVTPESKDAHLEEKVEPITKGPKQRPGPNDDATEQSLASLKQILPSDPNTGEFQHAPQSLPVSDVEDDPSAPAFIVAKNAYGPGVPSVRLSNGTPVGVWLKSEYPDLTGAEVEDLVARMGMEEVLPGHSAKLGRWRDGAIAARRELAGMPAVTEFAKAERLHEEQTAGMRKAFVEAKKKEKK